ncbi:hypothetical protein Esti_003867 [Eimeria stiedai]
MLAQLSVLRGPWSGGPLGGALGPSSNLLYVRRLKFAAPGGPPLYPHAAARGPLCTASSFVLLSGLPCRRSSSSSSGSSSSSSGSSSCSCFSVQLVASFPQHPRDTQVLVSRRSATTAQAEAAAAAAADAASAAPAAAKWQTGFPVRYYGTAAAVQTAETGATAADAAAAGAAAATAAAAPRVQGMRQLALWTQPYWRLAKGRLSFLVSLSSLGGFIAAQQAGHSAAAAADDAASDALAAAAAAASAGRWGMEGGLGALFVGVFLSSACANGLNQIIERHRDAKMLRTKNRPLPSGTLAVSSALRFAVCCGVSGAALLQWAFPGAAAAAVSVCTSALYAGVYTHLKTISPFCTHVGAVVGALPLLIGWTAGGGPLLSWGSLLTCALQFFWQMPHFYCLCFLFSADYLRGGYRIFGLPGLGGLPKLLSLSNRHFAALALLPIVAAWGGLTSWMYPISALPANLYLLMLLRQFNVSPSKETAVPFFRHSLWHILLLLGLAAYHIKPQQQQQQQQQHSGAVSPCPMKLLARVSPLSASLTAATDPLCRASSSDSDTTVQHQQQLLLVVQHLLQLPHCLRCPLGKEGAAAAALQQQQDVFAGARQLLSLFCAATAATAAAVATTTAAAAAKARACSSLNEDPPHHPAAAASPNAAVDAATAAAAATGAASAAARAAAVHGTLGPQFFPSPHRATSINVTATAAANNWSWSAELLLLLPVLLAAFHGLTHVVSSPCFEEDKSSSGISKCCCCCCWCCYDA